MNDRKRTKTPPQIPKEAADDIPKEAAADKELDRTDTNQGAKSREHNQLAPPVSPKQAEPKNFLQWLDQLKFQFGKNLIGWCLTLIVGLSLIDFFWVGADPERNALGPAIELLKLVTTTALGFVFAKSQLDNYNDQ